MATETSKRNPNSASKNRKSRNEIIRSSLGMYLKQRNYMVSDKYRKSDLCLTEDIRHTKYNITMDEDISKVNSVLYSNVLCLSNNSQIVEQQFTKFMQFVQSQNHAIKSELQLLLCPMLCHLYIELLKGKDAQPAIEFLRRFANIVAPVDNLETPLANKINGSASVAMSLNSIENDIIGSGAGAVGGSSGAQANGTNITPSATTQITFLREPENDHTTHGYFKNLVQLMSTCLRIDELDSMEITRNFRYGKYETELSLQTLYALKHYLLKNGHVIILHILQTWFLFEIIDGLDGPMMDDDDAIYGADSDSDLTDIIDMDFNLTKHRLDHLTTQQNQQFKRPLSSSSSSATFVKPAAVSNPANMSSSNGNNRTSSTLNDATKSETSQKRNNVRQTVVKLTNRTEEPIRVLKVVNSDNRLACGDIDPAECHLVCGFADSTVKLWQLNHSTIGGRKPFARFSTRTCEWSLTNYEIESSDDDDDDDEKHDTKFGITSHRKRPTYMDHTTERRDERSLREWCHENVFTDSGGITLRGHSRGVTGVLFSRQHPILLTTSKDLTMRAWRASNYECAAVYRGHTYPVWCVAESSLGLYLATGSRDLTARLWATDRQHPLQTYIGHTQDVDTIAFHPNSNYIATGSTDLTVRLWCVTSGKLFRVFTDCHLPIQCVSFSPDGKLLAAGGEESKIRIFDLAAGSQLSELKDHTAPVTNLVWNSNSTKLASCCMDGSIRVFNVSKCSAQASTSSTVSPTSSSSTSASTLSSSSSSSSNANKLIMSCASDCAQTIRVIFNSNDTISTIGSS